MKTLRILVGVVLFAAVASAQCAFKYNPLSPFLAYVCAGTTGPGIGGAASLTGTGGVLYDASAGTAGVSTGFLRTGVGKYTLYDPTATTGSTVFTIKPGAGQASTNLFELWLNTAGSTPGVHVTPGGNLGVGTSSPSVLVHMKSASGPSFRLERTSYTPRFDVETDGTNMNIVQQDTGAYAVNFKRGATGLMTIANSGKIGVGSTTKLSQFTVTPVADATNIGGTTTANASTTIAGSGTTFLTSLGIGDRISLSSAASTYATVTAIASDTSLTVDSALGNGTSQTINRKSSIFRLDDASNATKFVVTDTGNVGIGTTGPGEKLTIIGTGSTAASSLSVLGDGGAKVKLGSSTGAGEAFLGTDTNHPLYFYTNGTERMRILNTGNVGIGTTSPAQKLDVNGTIGGTPGGTVPACATTTIPYTDVAFTAAATAVDVTVFSLPAKGKITGVTIKHSAAFAGTGITSATVSVGDGVTPYDQYASAFNIFTVASDTNFQDTSLFKSTTMAASTVKARFTANTNWGNGSGSTFLTSGSVSVSYCAVVLP